MLCQSLFFNKASGLKPVFQVWEHPFHKTPLGDCFWFLQSILYRSCVFVKENWNILYIWYKAFSFIIFDNYQLKIILNRKVPSFLKVATNLFQALTFTFLFVAGMFFTSNGRKLPLISEKPFPVKLLWCPL